MAGAVAEAARAARRQLLEMAAELFEARVEDITLQEGAAAVRGLPGRTIPLPNWRLKPRIGAAAQGRLLARGARPQVTAQPVLSSIS